MARDILEHVKKEPYLNALGNIIEITHVEVTYYEFHKDDNKRTIILSLAEANEFANKTGITNPYVSAVYDKEEALRRGF